MVESRGPNIKEYPRISPDFMVCNSSPPSCQMCDIKSTSRGNAVAPNRCNSVPCTVRTSRQRSCDRRVGCLLFSMPRIYDLRNGSLDRHKVRCLVPCYGQIGYRAQVLQHPIDKYRYTPITTTKRGRKFKKKGIKKIKKITYKHT